MKVVAFAPIRLNNTRLPGKNLLPLGKKPLLNWAVEHVDELGIDNYVYCSNEQVKTQFTSQKVRFLQRPADLDNDGVLGEDIYRSFAEKVPADVYLLYHVTSPLMASRYYQMGIDAVIRKGYDSAFSVAEVKTFCLFQGRPLNFREGTKLPRTQDLEPVHQITSGFFVYTHEVLHKLGCRIGRNPMAVVVDEHAAIDIDYKLDYDVARLIVGDI
jgi:CMP-N-acetylneuraminic acid synthetase